MDYGKEEARNVRWIRSTWKLQRWLKVSRCYSKLVPDCSRVLAERALQGLLAVNGLLGWQRTHHTTSLKGHLQASQRVFVVHVQVGRGGGGAAVVVISWLLLVLRCDARGDGRGGGHGRRGGQLRPRAVRWRATRGEEVEDRVWLRGGVLLQRGGVLLRREMLTRWGSLQHSAWYLGQLGAVWRLHDGPSQHPQGSVGVVVRVSWVVRPRLAVVRLRGRVLDTAVAVVVARRDTGIVVDRSLFWFLFLLHKTKKYRIQYC